MRIKVELAEAVPDGMVGTLHREAVTKLAGETYGRRFRRGQRPAPNNERRGQRPAPNNEAGAPLPGFTLEFSTAGASSTSDSIQKSYLAVKEARYADNFLVAAHPNQNIVRSTSSGRTTPKS